MRSGTVERAGTEHRPYDYFGVGKRHCRVLYHVEECNRNWHDLTAENAENAESEKREMNNSDEGRISKSIRLMTIE